MSLHWSLRNSAASKSFDYVDGRAGWFMIDHSFGTPICRDPILESDWSVYSRAMEVGKHWVQQFLRKFR